MTDMSEDRLEMEWKRQVYLCSGLGREFMLAAVNAHFDDDSVSDTFRYGIYGKPKENES